VNVGEQEIRPIAGNIACIAFDYGGTLSQDRVDHLLGEKPVDPAAAAAVRVLHDDLGLRLILASNTRPGERRWPALAAAGIDGLFCCALLSYPLGTAKPEPLFWSLLLAAAGCPAGQVLVCGDSLRNDVAAPLEHGMRAVLVRPDGLRPGELLPDRALMISHVADLPALVLEER
jgi:FMN phosphatase YigB (HAD superfamily)